MPYSVLRTTSKKRHNSPFLRSKVTDEAEHAILFLDEIDGLVQSRDRAQRSWEVTPVKELLYQMENFNGVMVGATNFVTNLDPAVLRRFTFKLEFYYLDNAGKRLFFERMFKTALTEEETRHLNAIPLWPPATSGRSGRASSTWAVNPRPMRRGWRHWSGKVRKNSRTAAAIPERSGFRGCQKKERFRQISLHFSAGTVIFSNIHE